MKSSFWWEKQVNSMAAATPEVLAERELPQEVLEAVSHPQ